MLGDVSYIKLLYNPRVNKVFTFTFTFTAYQKFIFYFQFFKKHSDVFRFSDFSEWVSLNSSSEDSGNSQSISVPKQEEPNSLRNDSKGRSNQSLRYAVDSYLLQIYTK